MAERFERHHHPLSSSSPHLKQRTLINQSIIRVSFEKQKQ